MLRLILLSIQRFTDRQLTPLSTAQPFCSENLLEAITE